jgi:hypothetical protein
MNVLVKENNRYEYTSAEIMKVSQGNETIVQEKSTQLATLKDLLSKKENEINHLKTENEKLVFKLNNFLNDERKNSISEKEKEEEISLTTTSQYDRDFSPSKSRHSKRTSQKDKGVAFAYPDDLDSLSSKSLRKERNNSLQSQSQPLPRKLSPPPTAPQPLAPVSQTYYKGIPIEQYRAKTAQISSSSLGLLDDPTPIPVNTRHTSAGGASLVVYPANGPVLVGLEGMKHIRNLNSKEYLRHQQHYLHSSPTTTLPPLANLTSENEVITTENPSKYHSGITRDINGTVILHENIEKMLQKRINTDIELTQSPQITPHSQTQANEPLATISPKNTRKARGSVVSNSFKKDEADKKLLGEKKEMIEKILSENYQRKEKEKKDRLSKREESDEESIESLQSETSQTRGGSRPKGREPTADKDRTKTKESKRPNKTADGSKDSSKKIPKRKYLDPLHHKLPCSQCGMHFSGDGMKLPPQQLASSLQLYDTGLTPSEKAHMLGKYSPNSLTYLLTYLEVLSKRFCSVPSIVREFGEKINQTPLTHIAVN